jgi:hypothetical protein
MTFDWLIMLITTCCGAYIGNLLAKITIDRNELKLKRRLLDLEESSSKPDSELTETPVKIQEERIKNDFGKVKTHLARLALHHKWLYGQEGGVRCTQYLKDEVCLDDGLERDFWMGIHDYHFLLTQFLKKYSILRSTELFMSFGFDNSIDYILTELLKSMRQMKDPYGRIDEDNKFASKGDIKEALNGL